MSTLTRSRKVCSWNTVADLPVALSSAVTLHGQLLAIGGKDSNEKSTTAIHIYQPATNSWEIISHMTTPRSKCLAAVLPDDQLMVVGGYASDNKLCNFVEFGNFDM